MHHDASTHRPRLYSNGRRDLYSPSGTTSPAFALPPHLNGCGGQMSVQERSCVIAGSAAVRRRTPHLPRETPAFVFATHHVRLVLHRGHRNTNAPHRLRHGNTYPAVYITLDYLFQRPAGKTSFSITFRSYCRAKGIPIYEHCRLQQTVRSKHEDVEQNTNLAANETRRGHDKSGQ